MTVRVVRAAMREYTCSHCGGTIPRGAEYLPLTANYEKRTLCIPCVPAGATLRRQINSEAKRPGPVGWPFERFYKPDEATGCWLWVGHVEKMRGSTGGYGIIRRDGKRRHAHRVSWELHRGPIPDELQVNHHCDVRHCVNPEHLYLGTQKDNMRDACVRLRMNVPGVTKGFPRMNAEKTHCKHGHEFTPENTHRYIRKSTGRPVRQCRTCERAARKTPAAKARAAAWKRQQRIAS